jgi:hypothetical protein
VPLLFDTIVLLYVSGAIMNLKPTQVYLTEAEHAALQAAAERSGRSMTSVIRDLIDRHLMGNAAPPTDLTELIGVVNTARPTDVAVERDRLLYEDLVADLRRHERAVRVAES